MRGVLHLTMEYGSDLSFHFYSDGWTKSAFVFKQMLTFCISAVNALKLPVSAWCTTPKMVSVCRSEYKTPAQCASVASRRQSASVWRSAAAGNTDGGYPWRKMNPRENAFYCSRQPDINQTNTRRMNVALGLYCFMVCWMGLVLY